MYDALIVERVHVSAYIYIQINDLPEICRCYEHLPEYNMFNAVHNKTQHTKRCDRGGGRLLSRSCTKPNADHLKHLNHLFLIFVLQIAGCGHMPGTTVFRGGFIYINPVSFAKMGKDADKSCQT